MNDRSRRLLPPMAALHSFAAAARHGAFSKAADEIGLTQSAVSRQIALLEDWLQTPLFDRTGRRVSLNDAGREYAEAVGPALDAIRRGTARAMARPDERSINLATLPSFGMRWLAPRLPHLTEQHPDLIVNFSARTDEFDFAEEPFDAAIHFGRPTWPGVTHDLLFRERAIPVVSPDMLAAHPVTEPTDLLAFPLLLQELRPGAWKAWFEQAGVAMPDQPPGPSFSHFLMLAQAVAAGAGAALIPSFLVAPELASGALVSPLDIAVMGDEAYYLVYPPDRLANPRFRALREWILSEAAESS